MTAAAPGEPTDIPAAPHPPRSALERILIVAVIAMGILIVIGLLAVIGRMIYLASRPAMQQAAMGTAVASARLTLPSGAMIRSVSLSGDRLAVHYDAATGAGIVVLDVATGRTLSRIELMPEPPR